MPGPFLSLAHSLRSGTPSSNLSYCGFAMCCLWALRATYLNITSITPHFMRRAIMRPGSMAVFSGGTLFYTRLTQGHAPPRY